MRNTLRCAAASVAAASLVAAAAGANAESPASVAPVAEAGTGSSMLDAGSSAAQSAGYLAQRGDIIGVLVLLGITPFQMLTSGICDLATGSGLGNPCSPSRY
ncbi:hypothetical protein GV791_28945 [Nocardia cyriacigeorgica]|uniref:Secreted protein n=2 Tax=Nocardia cyriacigeorgica TaxID=135487 RepID=A0A6P1D1Q1_9NOCA|nr:hypothetical protein [Nocardia cyriacigeorgica]MBF6285709.1 hypothetical protein [Nocardia cyriacigeorgica]MBF6427821.1 hypothetical protein [Nocardia cyriacigeorgica]NEW36555.1 hypothetical protein [Nocardia cyriacigeorgica]BDT87116.1 hypothetical protein FMUAM8_28800 [Nocardia cyriacigeorgica]BDU06605.1 hypothetical protein FMUBM48_28680 [Nocardia cyriacigeorgica]